MKNLIYFILAVAISLPAAIYRWGDSAHSSGFITADGGSVRHTRALESGYSRYSLVATARVRPPYRGDARVVLEGAPELDHEIDISSLAMDLGFRKRPKLKDRTIYDIEPGDKINIRVVLKEPASGKSIRGRYILALYDTQTGSPIFRVPWEFKTTGGAENGRHNPGGQ